MKLFFTIQFNHLRFLISNIFLFHLHVVVVLNLYHRSIVLMNVNTSLV